MNKRIVAISNLITKCNNIIDIGCDHCWLAIHLLLNQKIKFAYNIDINQKPLAQGIKNLTKFNLLNQTKNIVNDGLKNLIFDKKKINYIIIAGMGTDNIIQIINEININFDYLIVQTNTNLSKFREFINDKYKILKEVYVKENNIIYPILKIANKKNKIIDNAFIYLGDLKKIINKNLYFEYLINRYNQLSKIINFNQRYESEFNYLRDFLKFKVF